MFLYQKLIDRSTLRQGFQIPVEFHHLLKAMPDGMPQHGETRNVKVVIDGVGYDAQLKNQGFDRNKYDGHADVLIPFTESMNNDTSNIIILSPSYHRIIHKAKPMFDRPSLSFHFPNGLVENVKIDKHLAI